MTVIVRFTSRWKLVYRGREQEGRHSGREKERRRCWKSKTGRRKVLEGEIWMEEKTGKWKDGDVGRKWKRNEENSIGESGRGVGGEGKGKDCDNGRERKTDWEESIGLEEGIWVEREKEKEG